MGLLNKNNWFTNLLLTLLTEGLYIFVLGYFLKVYDKKSWYANWKYWVIGACFLFFPVIIMFMIFRIQIMIEVCKKLQVPGKEIYSLPYSWIICLIVPVFGWALLIVMLLYMMIWPSIMIKNGIGEEDIEY